MKKLGLILLLLSPLGCAPSDSKSTDGSPSTPADSNATSAAVRPTDDTATVQVALAVPGMQ